jgi:hypothetical protein
MVSERPTSLTSTSRCTSQNQSSVGGYPPGRSAQAPETHGRPGSRSRTFGSNSKSSEEQSMMSEIQQLSTPIAQLVRPADLELREGGYELESPSGRSFAEIVKNEKTKRSQECFAESILEPNGPSFASQKCTGGSQASRFSLGTARKFLNPQAMQTLQSAHISNPRLTMKRSNWIGPRKL